MKKLLGDGLLQLAIALSLLRTEFNLSNYINDLYNLNSMPETHEILLGPIAGYTQTSNIHNQPWNNFDGTYSHPKSIDSYYSGSVFRDLHSLGHYRRYEGVNTDINAVYLVSNPVTPLASEQADTNDVPQAGSGEAHGHQQQEGAMSLEHDPSPQSEVHPHFPAADLTKEDMDLIDILWRQDMDLGIARDMYDANMRRDADKKREMELQQHQAKEQLELVKKEKEEAQKQAAHDANFIVDGETGELVPVGPGTSGLGVDCADGLPLPPPYTEPTPTEQNLSIEEAMRILEQQVEEPALQNVTGQTNATTSQLQQEIDQYLQTQGANQMTFSRQNSFEQRWADVANLLQDMGDPSATGQAVPSNMPLHHHMTAPDMVHTDITMENNTQSPLVHNVSMPQGVNNTHFPFSPEVQGSAFTPFTAMNNTFPPTHYSPNVTAPGMLPTTANNHSQFFSMESGAAPVTFPNMTDLGIPSCGQAPNLTDADSLLQQILKDDDDLDFDLPLNDAPPPMTAESMQIETASTSGDSAVSSMGPSNSPSFQDMNETRSVASTFDGLEGATGGTESEQSSPFPTKQEKFDPDYTYAEFGYRPADLHINASSGNETDPGYHGYADADMKQVAHNHTYPLQPGQSPKEKKMSLEDKKSRTAISRDERRARALNVPFSVATIIHSPVEEFNELLTKYKLNEPQLQLIRDIRRRGKNKVAAQNCRKRKIDVITTLDDDVQKLRNERERLARERRALEKEMGEMREKFGHMYREVFRSLRDDAGRPYNPNEYSLQQTGDGNVFLVPRNTSQADDPQEKSSRKRKAHRK